MAAGNIDDAEFVKIFEILKKNYKVEDGNKEAILICIRHMLDIIAPFRKSHEEK